MQERDMSILEEVSQAAYKEFIDKELSNVGDKEAAQLTGNILMHVFDDDFLDMESGGGAFETFLSVNDADEAAGGALEQTRSLRKMYQSFKRSLSEVPVSTARIDPAEELGATPGDEEQEAKDSLYKHVIALRAKSIQIYNVKAWSKDVFKTGGAMHALLQRSNFISAKGEAGKSNSLIMLSADLFPGALMHPEARAQKAVGFQGLLKSSDFMADAIKWMMSVRCANTVVLVLDGRSRHVRRAVEDILETSVPDEQRLFDGSVIYGHPDSKDPRFSTRKVFSGFQSREAVIGVLPVARIRMVSKPREHFSACGEKSTHSNSYTNVPLRPFQSLPRLSVPDKESILGVSLPTYTEEVVAACGARGHPLFEQEVKSVDLFIAMFEDFNVTHIWDLTIGSCAAACAAAALEISYEGVAMNEKHANWCRRIMDKAMFAIVADREDDESKKLRADLHTFFGPLIEEARQFLLSDSGDMDIDKDVESPSDEEAVED
jgi:hypothetical protein